MSDVGRSVSSKGKSALVLGLLSATFAMSAHAQNKPILFEGIYRIGIESSGHRAAGGSMPDSRTVKAITSVISGPPAARARWCGFPTLSQYPAERAG